MRNLALALALAVLAAASAAAGTFASGGPVTTNNDDVCDIGNYPAATLLLPYFEVDIASPQGTGETTLFTITNTTNVPQVAHITLWTSWAFPVITFNLYLTGYDVQSINLYDVIVFGRIASTGSHISPVGALSGDMDVDHDNPRVNEASCDAAVPGQLPQIYIDRMQRAFTLGRIPQFGETGPCNFIGDVHANAIGYATIDVYDHCSVVQPTDHGYFDHILFDNVLMGDYQQVNGSLNFAQGNPMVHIRAVPEGGTAAERADNPRYQVNFSRTFYSRLLPADKRTFDARQPLPSTLAARWINGGPSGFQTFYKLWREATTGAGVACDHYSHNASMLLTEIVRFDEEENPRTHANDPPPICDPPPCQSPQLPALSLVNAQDTSVFPSPDGEFAGWFYLNLDRVPEDELASQAWIVASMRAEGRYSVDFDAVAFGNGCTSPAIKISP